MRVICVEKVEGEEYSNITIGKEYEYQTSIGTSDSPLESCNNIYYLITDESNATFIYPSNCFMTKEEYRNKKLEELGI